MAHNGLHKSAAQEADEDKQPVQQVTNFDFSEEFKALGEYISAEYTARGCTQMEFAKLTGISVSDLRRIEKGEVQFRMTKLFIIAQALRTTPDALLKEAMRIKTSLAIVAGPDRKCDKSVTKCTKGGAQKGNVTKKVKCLDGGDKRAKIKNNKTLLFTYAWYLC